MSSNNIFDIEFIYFSFFEFWIFMFLISSNVISFISLDENSVN